MGSFFNSAYIGRPPWDIGRPQIEFKRMAEAREITGRVLDVGCGTGENALYIASLGHKVSGIDISPLAIRRAEVKARERGLDVQFEVWDALEMDRLRRRFDAVVDSGLFHIFTDEERPRFVKGLRAVLFPGGTYQMLCFSESEPKSWGGPRRVSRAEIRQTFGPGWRINHIREAVFETNFHSEGGRAWLSSIIRL